VRGFTIFAVGLALFAGSPATAQEVLNPSPRAQELAARYVEIFDLRRMMVEQYTGAADLSDEMMVGMEALGVPLKGDDEAMTSMPTFMPDGSLDEMEPMLALMESVMVQAVAETYPEAELEALVAFYDTEVGRTIMGRQGALQLRMTGLLFERMPEMLAAMGVDADAYGALYGLGGGYTDAPAAPTRQMQSGSSPAYGMSLNDIMIYGAAEADAAAAAEAAAMAVMLEDYDY
jgi:hypothetical protein